MEQNGAEVRRSLITRYSIIVSKFILGFSLFSGIFAVLNPLSASDKELRFSHITSQEGLSNDIVNCITQDHLGFIWIGTMGGLNRYDGSSMKVFKRTLNDSTSIADNMIFAIYCDYQNKMWVGTQNGLCLYKPDLEEFETFVLDTERIKINPANRVTGIDENSANELLVAAEIGTLYKQDRETGEFEPYNYDFRSIIDFMVDSEDRIWIGGVEGLYSYNSSDGEVKHYSFQDPNGSEVLIKEVNTLFEEGDTIWIGTTRGKVFYILKSSGETRALEYDFNKTYYIFEITKCSDGMLYFSTTDGLFIYDKEKDNYLSYQYEKENSFGLNTPGVTTVLEDFQNNLWIGSYQGGVNFVSYSKEFYNFNEFSKGITLDLTNINSILEDNNGKLWLGSFDLGINVIDPATNHRKTFFHDPDDKQSLGYGSVYAIYEDSKGNIWTGTYLGYLQRYNPRTHDFTSFPFAAGEGPRNRGLDVRSIHEDGEGNIWIISHGNGLSRLDPTTGIYKHYVRDIEDLEHSLADNWAFQILQDHIGYFWIATPSGLSRFDRKAEIFRNFFHDNTDTTSICNNFINVLFEDSNKQLWIGTKFGLSLFDRGKDKFIHFYENQGLPSNDIKAILEHVPGELWISTGYGLSRMKYETYENGKIRAEFRNYTKSDNLQDDFFWDRAACKTRDGKLIFGCEEGIIMFDPDRISDNTSEPEVFLTSFQLSDEEVIPGGAGSVLDEHISKTKKITLKHDQNFFTLGFVAINYISNDKNRYKYILEGFDSHWIDAGSTRKASYTNVDPGRYIFRVIASNNDDYWNEEGVSLEIIIRPPLYGTWWFRVLSVLIIALLAIAFYRLRVTSLRAQNLLLESKVEERIRELSELNEKFRQQNEMLKEQRATTDKAYNELDLYKNKLEDLVEERTKELIVSKEKAEEADQLKTSFLTNLSHEIRTPLNSIIGFSSLMMDSDLSDEERLSFKSIIEGSNNALLSLINDIIDFSKIEAGHLDIIMKEVMLDTIFEDLQKIYSLEIKKQTQEIEKGIEFRVNVDKKARGLILITDEIRLKQLLSILINNAIKFTHEGYVEVGCHLRDNERLEFYVKDTGIGIEQKYHAIIFQRFRKLEDENKLYRGAGIGLSIAQELVKRLGGEISLESVPDQGTRFFFSIPIKSREIKKISKTTAAPQTEIPDLSGQKILIAEDDQSNFAYLERLLRKTHASVLHAVNGKKAVELYENNPDLIMVFMDIKMPVMNGIEALTELLAKKIEIPVIAQTAYAFSDEIRKIKAAGFSDYISKPINARELYSLIFKHIQV